MAIRPLQRLLASTAIVIGLCDIANAALMLTLRSPNDLMSLVPGEPIRIDVSLTGLDEGNETIEAIGAELAVPRALFSVVGTPIPTARSQGGIIPDATGFFESVVNNNGTSFVGGLFDDDFGELPPIDQNGILFSFELKALEAGSGAIAFDLNAPPQVLGTTISTDEPITDIQAGAALPFFIAVPEPATSLLVLTTLVGLACRRSSSHSRDAYTQT